ncbi:MAG: 4-hydroxy-3-methylbut-2-enyl diphosphate reductase [Maricaulis sp.]|jgi:4-hydroxy-3-methylbut-2-enyl diphosphate reductase|nr:4-hydroxy-3-methylbut-2-enyl diphosphate reductase [Maricaulis sp.]MDG2044362.1 4-hydroxy-3-methylbut-2-enyl diphosphate reductase [Maricaulis sp.]
MHPNRPDLTLLLAAPRGFCAGVDRAIQIVERALERFGAPVYVRHEIVHNRHVVERLEGLGAIFVERLDQCPQDRPVIFSAHGVPKRVPAEAERRNMIYVDATCPLVSKVHVEAQRHLAEGREIVLIGHAGHPEVIGTMGQLPDGAITLIETIEDADRFTPEDASKLAFVTQTTLSVDDTQQIVTRLQQRFPQISSPHKEDICYATTNRQAAVKALAERCDLVLVIGATNSSNSVRLVEVALTAGAKRAQLISSVDKVDWSSMDGIETVGITAGASAPDVLVQDLLDAFATRFNVIEEVISVAKEDVVFKLPKIIA